MNHQERFLWGTTRDGSRGSFSTCRIDPPGRCGFSLFEERSFEEKSLLKNSFWNKEIYFKRSGVRNFFSGKALF